VSVAVLIEDALTMVSVEHRPAYDHLRDVLGACAIEAWIGDETIHVAFATETTSSVDIRTDLETICEVLEGEAPMLDVLVAGRLHLVGSPDDLISVSAALTIFLEGAMRCTSIATLVDRLHLLREGAKS
jgi:hypothetical protein